MVARLSDRIRPRGVLAVLTMLAALLLIAPTGGAQASPATGTLVIRKSTVFPPGVPHFLTARFNLNCNPGGQLYIAGSPNGQLVRANLPAPATCTVVELPAPAPPGCTWTPVQTPPGSVTILAGATTTINVSNRLSCNGAGRLEIRKLTNFPSGVAHFASVVFNVVCTPGGTNATLTVPANGAAVVPNIAAPVTCSVTEQPPPAPAGCSWTPAMVVAGGASAGAIPINTGLTSVVLVTNSLVCGGSTASTTLQVRKWVMVNGATMPSPAATLPPALQTTFPVTVACGSRPSVHVSLNSTNSYRDSVPVSPGETCTIQETGPPFPTAGCHWSVSYPQGASIAIALGANEINLYNTQVCP